MAISMFNISVPIFIRHLNGLAHCLKKAQAVYAEKKYDEGTLMIQRLYPDMFTFARQVQQASEAVAEHFPADCRLTRPEGGFVLWVELPAGVDGVGLFQAARVHRIAIDADDPQRLYAQNHGGVYRSDDAGRTAENYRGNRRCLVGLWPVHPGE